LLQAWARSEREAEDADIAWNDLCVSGLGLSVAVMAAIGDPEGWSLLLWD
jgi:hypothetical protein